MSNWYVPKKIKKVEYLLFEDMDLTFTNDEVKKFDYLWKEGLDIRDIAKYLDRNIEEVNLLAFDRATKNRIQRRENGIYGSYGYLQSKKLAQ